MWESLFQPITAVGPHVITVKSPTCEIKLENILIGDVWICSGQSNMAMKLSKVSPTYAFFDFK